MVGQHPDRVAVDRGPPGDQAGAVQRLELVEARSRRPPGPAPRGGRRGPWGRPRRCRAARRGRGPGRRPARSDRDPCLRQLSRRDDLAAEADGVDLVGGQVVGQAGHPGVHRRPAELLVGRLLAGGHLHQGRPAEEDLGALLDHDDVVAHARDVGAAGGGVAEHEGHGGEGGGRVPGEVPEGPAAGDEQLGLGGQVGAARLDQADRRQPVLEGDVRAPGALAEGERVHGPAADRGVGGPRQALDALDHADARGSRRPPPCTRCPTPPRGTARGRRRPGRAAARSARGRSACPARGGGPRSARRHRPGPSPAGRRPGRGPRARARSLARKVSEVGSTVEVRTGMGGDGSLVGASDRCPGSHLLRPTWEE